MNFKKSLCLSLFVSCVAATAAQAAELTVNLSAAQADGAGAAVGTVRIVETPYGLAFYPQLSGLPAGLHGFHVHENASCAPSTANGTTTPAGGAGGHFDPQGTKRHGEPWGDGHLGDLPPLFVAQDGKAINPVLSPRLKQLSELKGHALMVHAGGDNHSDHPAPLGGGGARVACGVIGG
ncbi:superoxide dismutase [Cu-Zn] SodC [Mitsuaria sp. GD03876]|uniref:superoxide dismutase [Cu-Zn] SodC n=1 Tax=Mitsuaria sp. GD03876 TaxID=2975399 RepID=UPI00244AA2C4|nr:superoxide dismutase [Cu-Zn] SodC [Mitsuaria sp. GD03876]MDH0865880.1 superoxide dismutase [Cu-Zn] SodC [Mitsuaria sp. GD03876]